MGSPRPNYGRVKGMYDNQGLAGGSRWGAFLGGQTNHNSYMEAEDGFDCLTANAYIPTSPFHPRRSLRSIGM